MQATSILASFHYAKKGLSYFKLHKVGYCAKSLSQTGFTKLKKAKYDVSGHYTGLEVEVDVEAEGTLA